MRKNATKLAALALTLAMTVTSVALPSSASAATKTVKLNTTSKTLYATGSSAKKTTTLKVTVNGKKKTATFKSSNTKVATVGKTSGKVTAKKAGKATITATYGGKKVKCKITVKAKFVKVTSVSVSPKTVSLAVGKTKTIKTTVKPSKASIKKVTYATSNKSVATVSSTGKITAKKAGTAKVTVTATDGTKKKATVTVKVTKATTPTATPSATPDATPVPTETPAATATSASATAITSFKQTGAAKLTAEFAGPVSDAAKVEVTKDGKVVDGTVKFSDDKKSVVFDAKADFVTAEYTITVTDGDKKLTEKVKAEAAKITDIKIKGETALTGKANEAAGDNTAAYIYYDVVNQFGEPMTTSADINWTISSSTNVKEDKANGKLTITRTKSDSTYETYTYGTEIYIVGVNVKSGLSVNKSVKIGMAQAIDEVEFKGFIDTKKDKTKFIQELPANFQKDRYVLCYSTLDQNGNKMEAVEYDTKDLTLLANKPLLVNSTLKADKIYSVGGVEYASVMVQPGSYVDNGGEVEFTMISNRTGQKTSQIYKVGEGAKLQSLTIEAPTDVVADGDENVTLKYTAKDTNGNETKNYETIVRSTNALTLSANPGTLTISEADNGEAVIKWSDETVAAGSGSTETSRAKRFDLSSAYDNQSRIVAISTIVAGGASNNMTFNVSDTRRPVAFKHIKLNGDDNNAIVDGNTARINLIGADDVKYLDQYDAELDNGKAEAFFKQAKTEFNGKKYAIKVSSTSADKAALGNADGFTKYYEDADSTLIYNADSTLEAKLKAVYAKTVTIATADTAATETERKAATEFLTEAKAIYNEVKTAYYPAGSDDATYKTAVDAVSGKLTALQTAITASATSSTQLGTAVTDVKTEIGSSDSDTNKLRAEAKALYGTKIKRERANVTVKYAIVAKDKNAEDTKYTEVSKVDTEEYTVLPSSEVKDRLAITFNAPKLAADGAKSDKPNYGDTAPDGTAYAANFTSDGSGSGTSAKDFNDKDIAGFTVKGTTSDGKTVTIPKTAYTSDDTTSQIDTDGDRVIKLNDDVSVALKNTDFYDVNSAKNTRKDATGKLVLNAYGVKVAKSITISDAAPEAKEVKFTYKKKFATEGVEAPTNARLLTLKAATKLDETDDLRYVVLDQYNCPMATADSNPTGVAAAVAKTVSDITESETALNHLPNSFAPVQNGTATAYVDKVEIGDKYKLTVSVDGTNVSGSVNVTVGADKFAKIVNAADATTITPGSAAAVDTANTANTDKVFRENTLNMKRD